MLLNAKTIKVLVILGICSLLGYTSVLLLLGFMVKYL
jgi:hypothetical protein